MFATLHFQRMGRLEQGILSPGLGASRHLMPAFDANFLSESEKSPFPLSAIPLQGRSPAGLPAASPQ